MLKLFGFFHSQKTLLQLQREVKALRKDNARLTEKNESMRQGMRRCVTCDYRLDAKARLGKAPVLNSIPEHHSD